MGGLSGRVLEPGERVNTNTRGASTSIELSFYTAAVSRRARRPDFPAGEEGRFGCLWAAGKRAVAKVLMEEPEREGLMDRVWEKAWCGFAAALELERENEEKGKAFNWTAWLATIARNLLTDLVRRRKTFMEGAGMEVRLDEPRTEVWTGGGSEAYEALSAHETVADRWSWMPDELAEWRELCEVLWELVLNLPLLERKVVMAWLDEGTIAGVARKLEIPETSARRRRGRAFGELRAGLEERGYDRETRPRQPGTDRWGFITTRRKERKGAGTSEANTEVAVQREVRREAARRRDGRGGRAAAGAVSAVGSSKED